MKKIEIKAALEAIRSRADGGILKPEDVVRVARRPTHALHGLFTWDDSQAADQYRLMQARTIIRSVRITNPEDQFSPPAPAYVALRQDLPAGGYRRTEDVIGNEGLREALRETALSELRGWMKRYRTLSELTGNVAAAAGLEAAIEA